MNRKQFCRLFNHQEFELSKLCMYKECTFITRWACDQCILEKIHYHSQPNENHLILIDDILDVMKKNCTSLEKVKIQEFILHDKYRIQDLKDSQEYIQDMIRCFFEQYQQVRIRNNTQQQKKQISKQELFEFQLEDYYEWENTEYITTFQISPNEELIAFGGENKILKIVDLNTKYQVKEIVYDSYINFCKFSNDSNLLYVGQDYGTLNIYDLQKNYKRIFKQPSYDNWKYSSNIFDMKLIQNKEVITCAGDKSITIYGIKNDNQILNFEGHKDQVNQIEYDSTHKVIISCSRDKSIKFFKLKEGKNIINQQNAHKDEIMQILLLNNLLFSRSKKEIKYWHINYTQKQLKLFRKIIEKEQIYNFIIQDRVLIKITPRYIKIQDNNDFRVILKYRHYVDLQWGYLNSNQPRTLNYILILGIESIKVLKRVN